ncbi:MAG: MarR family transcriptional regulator [Anaerolineae bacterium]|nr:MarR family transcriptional regulator [Anaerolineae bacterium]
MANKNPIKLGPDFEERYPDSSALATESAMNLVRTSEMLVKQISLLLQPFDLSPASALVVSILADSPSPLSPNEIADRLIITRATVTGLLDSLERREYVRRLPHTSDRRMLLVELTDKGRQAVTEFRPIVHQHQKQWFQGLGEEEKQQLINSLHKLQEALSNEDV